MKRPAPYLILLLLAAASVSLATVLQPRALALTEAAGSDAALTVLLGDGRRIFANHLFVQADVAFHSGYYPSVFDQAAAPKDSRHMTAKEGTKEDEEHERAMNFLGQPHDWLEAFGRHFMITEHTHLEGGRERELLPWLKLSAEMDPHRIDTYTVASYWLRGPGLNKPEEAEKFLREGLRRNPDSYEILFELGRLCKENYHDTNRARNIWELALRRWRQQEATGKQPDPRTMEQITVNLARLEEQDRHFEQAISYLEMAKRASPNPKALQQQIDELRHKLAGDSGANSASAQHIPLN